MILIVTKVVVMTLAVTFCFFVCGCSSVEEQLSMHVSEYVDNFFVGEREGIVADFCDGKRENPFCMDGVSNGLVDYGVLCVRSEKFLGENVTFKLKIGNETYAGVLEQSPFDGSYLADIEHKSAGEEQISLEVLGMEMTLKNASKTFALTSSKALTKFAKIKKEELKKYMGKDFSAEVFVKMVCDSKNRDTICFFVVAKGQNGDVTGVLLDAKTAEVYQK